jgi:protein tyrosine/serine phosphatase
MNDRVIALHGVHNFRDYGGYKTHDGTKMRYGLLWRSGQHVDATDDDLTTIDQIGLRTVIDLRGDSERARFPCRRNDNFSAKVLFVSAETASEGNDAPHIEAARQVHSAEQAHMRMVELYRLMPFRPNLTRVFRLYFDALAQDNGPSLLHCLAGKDRTGLAAAFLHSLLGVHHDDIMADYMLTNVAGNIERRIAAGALTVRSNFGPQMSDEAVRTLMSVHPAYLNASFSEIAEKHGSVAAYAQAQLDVAPEKLARIKENLIGE